MLLSHSASVLSLVLERIGAQLPCSLTYKRTKPRPSEKMHQERKKRTRNEKWGRREYDCYLCLGTVKSARTSFLRLDFVFMFIQKSIAAWKKSEPKKKHDFRTLKKKMCKKYIKWNTLNSAQMQWSSNYWHERSLIMHTTNMVLQHCWRRHTQAHSLNKARMSLNTQRDRNTFVSLRCERKAAFTFSIRSLLTQLGSCWMKASTMSLRWDPVLASSSSCSLKAQI